MYKNTFGDSERYKMLEALTDKISNLDRYKRRKISTFMIRFNTEFLDINKIRFSKIDANIKSTMLNSMKHLYYQKIDTFYSKYGLEIASYMKNYINARLDSNNVVNIL